jgi:hypothetical protein
VHTAAPGFILSPRDLSAYEYRYQRRSGKALSLCRKDLHCRILGSRSGRYERFSSGL